MSYLPHPYPNKLRGAVGRLMAALEDYEDKFDAVLVTGLSGIVPGSIYAYLAGKRLVVLRKENEPNHGSWCEGQLWDTRYILIDDFMSSGRTIERLLSIKAHWECASPHLPVLLCLYDTCRTTDNETAHYILRYQRPNVWAVTIKQDVRPKPQEVTT